jgi:hypothetical protein
MDQCNIEGTHVAVFVPQKPTRPAGYRIFEIESGRHCLWHPHVPHTLDVQWPYVLAAHKHELKLWNGSLLVQSLQMTVHAMGFVAPRQAVVVWRQNRSKECGLSWGLFEVMPDSFKLVRGGTIPSGTVRRISTTHIEFATPHGSVQYLDMYKLQNEAEVDRTARLALRHRVPIVWNKTWLSQNHHDNRAITSPFDGTSHVMIDAPMRNPSVLLIQTRTELRTCNGRLSVILSPGIALTPDCRHIVIRENYASVCEPVRFEKRAIVSFHGCCGNAEADRCYRECKNQGGAYRDYENRLHALLSPVLDPGIVRDIFACF